MATVLRAKPAVTGPFTPDSLHLLQLAIDNWRLHGLVFVDLPWIVRKEYSDATRPPECRDIATPEGSFVASGEQSFLQLWDTNALPAGDGFIGWTPCLRDDPVDSWHQHGFMKAEWFIPLQELQNWEAILHAHIHIQQQIFNAIAEHLDDSRPAPAIDRLRISETQYDLVTNDIELGSYGLRQFKKKWYLFGTAVALPRFTQAIRHVT